MTVELLNMNLLDLMVMAMESPAATSEAHCDWLKASLAAILQNIELRRHFHSVSERSWVATESTDLWSGAPHTTHYYPNYYYWCIQKH